MPENGRGKLKLKNGQAFGKPALKKKKIHKKKADPEGNEATEVTQQPEGSDPAEAAVATKKLVPQAYEEEFATEIERAKEGKTKSTPWGSSFGHAPEILHGYKTKVTGKTAEERLDMRAARKTDKFCK